MNENKYKLLSSDYTAILKEALSLPSSDFEKFYLNKIAKHREANPDIFKGIHDSIKDLRSWYMQQYPQNEDTWPLYGLTNNDAIREFEASLYSYCRTNKQINYNKIDRLRDLFYEIESNQLKGAITDLKEATRPQQPKTFAELFEYTSKYNHIITLLSMDPFNLIDPNTLICRDDKNGNKTFLISILKNLHLKGYYQDDLNVTNDLLIAIAKNTFKVTIGIDTAKKAKKEDFDPSIEKQIPYASTLP